MIASAPVFAGILLLHAIHGDEHALRVGAPIEGSISEDAPGNPAPARGEFRSSAPWRGVTFPLAIERPVPHSLTLRSSDFDAYLVLRDAVGQVVAEDDDGFFGTNARIESSSLTPNVRYTIEVLAPEGFGSFTLALDTTPLERPSAEEALAIARADLQRGPVEMEKDDAGDRSFRSAHRDLAVAVAERAAGHSGEVEVSGASAVSRYQRLLAAEELRCLEQIVAVDTKAGGIATREIQAAVCALGRKRLDRGDNGEALVLFQRALGVQTELLGEEHADTATSLYSLGTTRLNLGRFDEALPVLERALAIRVRLLGEDHDDTADTLNNLALAQFNRGHLDEALSHFQRAFDIRLRTLGEEHEETALAFYYLGATHADLGHLDEGLPLLQRALEIRLRVLGEDHMNTVLTLESLAFAHSKQRLFDESLPYWQRAFDIRLRVFGEEHVETLKTLEQLAKTYSDCGRFDEALSCSQRAFDVRLRVLGEEHEDTLRSLGSVAGVHAQRNDFDEAVRLSRRISEIRLRTVGEDHRETARALYDLADVLLSAGLRDESLRLARRALDSQFRDFGSPDSPTSLTMKLLVEILMENGDMPALETLLVDHHRRCVEEFGATDPRVAPSVARLAIFEWGRGDREAASARVDEALRIGGWEGAATDHGNENLLFQLAQALRELGRIAEARTFAGYAVDLVETFHPGVERVYQRRCRLADILVDLGAFAEAEKEYSLALDSYRRSLGDDDPRTQEALVGLARAVADQGRAGDAETCLRSLLAIRERVLPNNHEDLQDVRLRLAESLRAQGKQDEADRVQETVTVATVYRPALLVDAPDRLETTTEQRTVALDAVITDYSGVADVKVVRDGFALSIRALEEQGEQVGKYLTQDKTGQKATLHFPIAFREGQSRIELVVSAQNRRGQWSDPQTFRIQYQPPQRDLYLLALGVQDYDDDALDLKCPVADVDGIVAAMNAQAGGFYSNVHVKRLVDREVTIPAVKRCLDQFLVPAQPRDTIVVFVAGHGVRTEHSDYYFLTSDATPADPYAGIDRPTIESLVTSDKLHAQRRLLLLDTCHAGGNTPGAGARAGAIRTLVQQDEVNRFRAANESTGLYILASSTDDSFAREANGNGLFTRAFLDGIAGDADTGALGDGNGLVEIEELKNHIYFQVLETSQGRQRATVPKVISGENFPIGRVRSGAAR